MRRLLLFALLGFCLGAFFAERHVSPWPAKDPGAALSEPSSDDADDPTPGLALCFKGFAAVAPDRMPVRVADRTHTRPDGRTPFAIAGRGPPQA